MKLRYPAVAAAAGAAAVAAAAAARPALLRWGADSEEAEETLPGDEVVGPADLIATRAISILAATREVWPWIAQLGQGRGGFYSYDVLENLVGCDIHSAGRVVPEWQHVEVGGEIRLAPQVGLLVATVLPGRALVLHGGVPIGNASPPYDFSWAFVLKEGPDGTSRLLVRERYRYTRPWSGLLVEPVSVVSFVMTQKMLRGIRDRAQGSGHGDAG
jgi:hypothetical protein